MVDVIKTKLVGVTYANDDGTNRQEILERMKDDDCEGMVLEFLHEYDNPKEKNAIAVYNKDWEKIGYLNRPLARDVAPMMDDGHPVYGILVKITGGTPSKPTYGCNIECPTIIDDDEDEKVGFKFVILYLLCIGFSALFILFVLFTLFQLSFR